MKIPSIIRTVKNTRRLAEILGVLVRFGFKQFVFDTGLHKLLGKSKESFTDIAQEETEQPRAVRVRLVMEELGPSFIKLGQILSTRPDLIPRQWAAEFKKLQTNCPHVPFEEIDDILQQEFPGGADQFFMSIDKEPLAAASIAQVHNAILLDGSKVVIKVLRPGVRESLEEDISLVESMAQLLEQRFSNLGYSPTAVVKEFSREILKEINLVLEGKSADRMRHDFEDDPDVYFPKIYWHSTTRNVLTMEKAQGKALSDISPQQLTKEERMNLVAICTDAVFKQCLQFGFFHADPHPGNIFLQPNGSLCFIDCGMVGQIDKGTTDQLVNLVTGVVRSDENMLCRVIMALTDADPAVLDGRSFRIELRQISSAFKNTELGELDISSLLSDFFSMLQRYRIQCPSDLMLLIKALTTIEGVALDFAPEFDVLAHVEPRIREVILHRNSLSAIRKRIITMLFRSFELLEELPQDIQRFLDQARHSRFTLNLEMQRVEHLADRVESASKLMGIAMIIAALIVGSSILILADRISKSPGLIGTLGIVGLILAGLFTTGFIISFITPSKRK